MKPESLVHPGATWQPGAWTPARCAYWTQSGPKRRAWLEREVMAEYHNGECWATQLPPTQDSLPTATE